MRTRTATVTAVLLAAALAGCSSGGDAEPAKTVTTTASPKLSKEEVTRQCVDALTERAMESEGEVPFDPTPAPCAPLGDSEYLDAYMDGISEANRAGLEERQRERDEASEAATAG
jgi:hypothetical protein